MNAFGARRHRGRVWRFRQAGPPLSATSRSGRRTRRNLRQQRLFKIEIGPHTDSFVAAPWTAWRCAGGWQQSRAGRRLQRRGGE